MSFARLLRKNGVLEEDFCVYTPESIYFGKGFMCGWKFMKMSINIMCLVEIAGKGEYNKYITSKLR